MRNYNLKLHKIKIDFEKLPDGINKELWLQAQFDTLKTELMFETLDLEKLMNDTYAKLFLTIKESDK